MCGPVASARYETGEPQPAYAAPSSEHENETGSSSLENPNVAEASDVAAGGAEVIVVSGGVVSIPNGPMWDVPLQLPAVFSSRRWNHQEPSGRSDETLVVVSSASFVVSG